MSAYPAALLHIIIQGSQSDVPRLEEIGAEIGFIRLAYWALAYPSQKETNIGQYRNSVYLLFQTVIYNYFYPTV